MRHARALWRLLRLLAHAVRGLWTIKTRFPGWNAAKREQAVQRWSKGILTLAGI
jgi:1-acyl-sn-glycerol-3-phosphate acyltransferase